MAGNDGGANTGGSKCKDPIFALLFYINLIAIIAVAGTKGTAALDSASSDYDFSGLINAVVSVSFLSLIMAGIMLALTMKFPVTMIKVSLIFVVLLSLIFVVVAFMFGSLVGGIIALVFFALTACYAKTVWSRIPFAAANMSTAIAAIKANFGVVIFAYVFPILSFLWLVVWSVAFAGVEESTYDAETGQPNYGYLFLLFLSMFFTAQVLSACVHVTIAGVIGTWWVAPEENGFCSGAVCNSFIRTMTTSFGSICFGSLLVAIIRSLEAIARQARQSEDGAAAIIACICECIIGCLGDILEYFNKWAYIYVGIHGTSYIESGKSVFQLFKNRGWEAIIADDLVGNVVLLTSLVSGAVMGGVTILIHQNTDWFSDIPGDPTVLAFFCGFIVGLIITAILLQVVASGVNAVIVMFAEAPAELQRNYPELSEKMVATWNGAYPGSTNA